MSGCFYGAGEDAHFERKLNEHLDRKARAEEADRDAIERVEEKEGASHVEDDLFEREDGTRFVVTSWPEKEQDYDRDEETGRIHPCGWTWSRHKIEEVEAEEVEELDTAEA